jgi:hypothetical protein
MGEKGNLTSDELSSMLGSQVSGAAALVGSAGDAVTTVVSDGDTTVVQTASSLGTKIADKTIGLGGDEIRDRIKERRENKPAPDEATTPPPAESSGSEPGSTPA